MTNSSITDQRKLARIAGLLYLFVIMAAGFGQGAVRSALIVPGDTAATAQNIMQSMFLFRMGFVADLTAFISDAAVAIIFYILLKPVNKTVSLLAATMRLLAHPAIAAVNLLNHYVVTQLLSGPGYLNAFDTAQLQSLVMLFLDLHRNGYLIGGAFFGVHLFLLGYLLYKSDLFPGVLGILIIVASLGYVTESFGNFLFPQYKDVYSWVVAVPAVIAEFSLTLWLLIKGVKIRPNNLL